MLSLAIILMIAVASLPLFTLSAKTNLRSEATLNYTYLGNDAMELICNLSRKINFEELENEMCKEGFIKDSLNYIYTFEYEDEKYLIIKFSEEENLIRVVTKIYADKNTSKLKAQYEALYSWYGGVF